MPEKSFESVEEGKLIKNNSRNIFLAALLACGFVVIAGCGLSLHDDAPPDSPPEFKAGDKAECLSEVLPVVKGFIKGTATAPAVERTWDCFRIALNLYGSYVRGRDDDRYTGRELAVFFELYFFKDLKINDQLLHEIMKIKQLLVGGDVRYLTRVELDQLIELSQVLKQNCLKLLPFMKVYSMNWHLGEVAVLEDEVHFFESANQAIQDSAKDLAAIFLKSGKSYDLASLGVLVAEVAKLYPTNEFNIAGFPEALPLVYRLKEALAGGNGQIVGANEWRRFVLLGARGYIQYLRYFYLIKTNDNIGADTKMVFVSDGVTDLLSYLGDMVAEKPGGVLERSELLNIFLAMGNFFPELKVSDSFLIEAMKIKRAFFGGDLEKFVATDFLRAKTKVKKIQNLVQSFQNYVNVYSMTWSIDVKDLDGSRSFFSKAEKNLLDVLGGIGDLAESSYDLLDLEKFINEYEKLGSDLFSGNGFGPQAIAVSVAPVIQKFLHVAIELKKIYMSDRSSVISQKQWSDFLRFSGQLYSRFLYAKFFFPKNFMAMNHLQGLKELQFFVADSVHILNSVVDRKPQKAILFSELTSLSNAILETEILPKELTSEIAKNLTQIVINKFLINPEARLAGQKPLGWTKNATAILVDEFRQWGKVQKFIESEVFRGSNFIRTYSPQEILAAFPNQLSDKPELAELKAVVSSPLTRSVDRLGRLVIGKADFPYSLYALDQLNLFRVMTRFLMRAYVGDVLRWKNYSGLTKSEANLMFNDLEPLLVAFDIIDEKTRGFADSRFLEANLFTPQSNGDNLGSFLEMNDLVLGLFSGVRIDSMLRSYMYGTDPRFLCKPKKVLVNGKKKDAVTSSCFVDLVNKLLPSVFASLPEQQVALQTLPRCPKISQFPWLLDEQRRKNATSLEIQQVAEADIEKYVKTCELSFDSYIGNVLIATGAKIDASNYALVSDTTMVPHLMQYIEQVMQRFDADKNGELNIDEAVNAFPLLRQTLEQVSDLHDDKSLLALLAYFLDKGKPPQTTFEKAHFFLVYKHDRSQWRIHAGRNRLALIFSYISASLPSAPVAMSVDLAAPINRQIDRHIH